MHLPTPQFSRLVTVLALDLSTSSLDSMILAWDHIAARFLSRKPTFPRPLADRIESIRLLAIHDAVIAILGPGAGFVFNGSSTGTSLAAALAATAQASHDILAHAFDDPASHEELADLLAESLSLISNDLEKAVGSATGAASASAFIATFGPHASFSSVTRFESPPHRTRPSGFLRRPEAAVPLAWARSA